MERVEFQGSLRIDQDRILFYPRDSWFTWYRRRMVYFVDKFGVLFFGRYWPMAGWTALMALGILLFTALAWSRWICCGGACCQRCKRAAPQALDPAVPRHIQLFGWLGLGALVKEPGGGRELWGHGRERCGRSGNCGRCGSVWVAVLGVWRACSLE